MMFDLQKASLLKRASAFILDAILLVVLATGMFCLISSITGYDGYQQTLDGAYERIREEYGVTDALLSKAAVPETLTESERTLLDAANAALEADAEACYAYQMLMNLSVLTITLGLLLSFLLLEFVVPLLFGNGQTVGKKIFSLGVMHMEGIRLGHVALFVRAILGKFTVEAMPIAMALLFVVSGLGYPVFILIAAVLAIAQIIVMIISYENAMLHDKMSYTVVIDLPSQMIFQNKDELLEYKKKTHADKAASSVY